MQTLANSSVAFIGAGNMASSLIQGLLRDGLPAGHIHVADPVAEQRDKLANLGVMTYEDNNLAIASADAIVLAVKPQVAQKVVSTLNGLRPSQVLISIAAGINLESLASWTSVAQAIVRCMPNTPALLGAGMSALFANHSCTTAQCDMATQILDAAGKTLWVQNEGALDAVTAVSGSGPAYFFLLMEAMIDAGVGLGLDRDTATELTLQTAYGAALMAREADESPGVKIRHAREAHRQAGYRDFLVVSVIAFTVDHRKPNASVGWIL